MRKTLSGLILVGLLSSGCGLELLTTAAIQSELQGRQAEEMTRQVQRQTENLGIPAEDVEKMEAIREAINEYGMATGFYPNTLEDLTPRYLAETPRTASGEAFIYNNQNGFLGHPRQQHTQTAETPGTPGSGITPMGGYMTGSGVREAMPQQGGSALSRTGGYAREGVQGTTDEYSDRQMQQIEELGF